MTAVLILLLVNAALGAFDTLWYHEYRAQLANNLSVTRVELRLHAARDAVYALLYGVLAWWTPSGWFVWAVAVGLVAEVVITMCDFVVEDRTRPRLGGIAAGERVLHSLMAIVYGAMLLRMVPELLAAAGEPTALVRHDTPLILSLGASAAAIGIAVSGARDTLALRGWFSADEPNEDRYLVRAGQRTSTPAADISAIARSPSPGWSSTGADAVVMTSHE